MSEADALLDAIFDHPDEDTPRLVYADWLQENGQQNYAEFIRLQCAVAHCKVWSDEANDLWVKIGRVWNRLAEEWWPITVDAWPGLPGGWQSSYCLDAVHFERGFLQKAVQVDIGHALRYPACRAWLPASGMKIRILSGDVPTVADSPLLRRIGNLVCVPEWDDNETILSTDFNPLLKSPNLSRLRCLDLTGVLLQPSTVNLLLTAPHLVSLEEIGVESWRRRDIDIEEAVLQLKSRFKRVIRN